MRCRWSGSTAAGYEGYDRDHEVELEGVQAPLRLSADTAFRGRAGRANPEQLLLVAASSCQLLEFLALAAKTRVVVTAYEDLAEAVMPEPAVGITEILLRPRITVAAGSELGKVLLLVEMAHRGCYVANSLRSRVVVRPEVLIASD